MTLKEFNALSPAEMREELFKCCGSTSWVENMATMSPFNGSDHVLSMAERCWHKCNENDWLEAFRRHPRLSDVENLKKKFQDASGLSGEVLDELALGNDAYEKKFGFIYILDATGKTAKVVLSILRIRLNNDPETEKIMAMVEQNKITRLRLKALLDQP